MLPLNLKRIHPKMSKRIYMYAHVVMALSHIPEARPAHFNFGKFGKCWQFRPVRCRSLGVRQHALFVRREHCTKAMHSLSFAVCVEKVVHAQKCARSSTHERRTRKTQERRQTRVERAGPTPDTRGAHAGYSFYVRRLRCSEHLAHT
jgi:hypothetical protein